MDLKIIITMSVILLSINIVLMGMGIFNPENMSKTMPFSLFTGDVNSSIYSGSPTIYYEDIPEGSEATDAFTAIPRYESQNYLEQTSTIKWILLGSLMGYTAVLNSIGLPYLIILLIVAVVTILQVVGFVYFIAWGWSAMFGGGV